MAGAIACGQTNKRANKTSKQASKQTYNETEITHLETGLHHIFPKAIPGLAEVDAWLGRPQRGVYVFKLKFHKDKILVDVEFQTTTAGYRLDSQLSAPHRFMTLGS